MSPASGAIVMGTGIVSVALLLDGRVTLSRVLLACTAAAWIVLGGLLGRRWFRDRARVRVEAGSPVALTGVAGTAVLGTRLTLLGWTWAGIALLAGAVVLWVVLLGTVLAHRPLPTAGSAFMLTVATESVALLGVAVAVHERADWLLALSFAPFVLGLASYPVVLARFDVRQLAVGAGDHWVSGGALAICALAAADITTGTHALSMLPGEGAALKGLSVGLWALAMLWLPALVVAEALHPRRRYDVRRWSTVFPVGMYAACSFAVANAAGTPGIEDFARAWIWVAVAVWLVVVAGMARRG
jgi:tellurite resistance protein TehA-like permease